VTGRGGDPLDDLDADIRDHIERETDENIARGMAPDEAAAAARRAFGSVALTREAARAVWIPLWIDRGRQDAVYAVRSFARAPGFTIVALLTLALAIGVNTAIFSLVYGVLLRPLPFGGGQRIVRLAEYHPGATATRRDAMLTNVAFEAWRRDRRALDALAGYAERAYDVTGAGDAERVRAAAVSPELFRMLEVTPAAGRFFDPADARAGADAVVVLGFGYWQQRFGGRTDAIGRTISLDGEPRTIVGVAPAGFSFPDRDRRLFTPFVVPRTRNDAGAPQVRVVTAIGRLAPGASLARVEAEGTSIVRALGPSVAADILFGRGGPPAVRARSMIDEATATVRPMMVLLAAGVVLVLLAGCANVANLFLFRSAGRARELAVRAAIGAGRARLVQQLLTESLLVAAAGGVVGTLVGWRLIVSWPALAPRTVPRLDQVRLDGTALAFAVLATLAAGLLAGVAPALQSAPSNLVAALRDGPGASAARATKLRRALLVLETALAVVLLVGSALLVRSFMRVLARDPGFDASHVLTGRVSPQGDPTNVVRWQQLARGIVERVRALPGVESAGAASMAPLGDSTFNIGFRLSGDRPEPVVARARGYVVTPGYAEALRLRVIEGRTISDADVSATTEAMVVNEQFARMYLNDGRPILGRRYPHLLDPTLTAEIVGVVGNVLKNGLLDVPEPEIFVALGNHGLLVVGREINLVVRAKSEPAELTASLRSIVRDLDRDAPLHNANVLAAELTATAGETRFATMMVAAFATLSLSLAAIGLYGLLSYDVSRRWRELGVRAALGATRRRLIALVVAEGMSLTAAGLVVGLLIAAGAARLLRALMFGIGPFDPVSFVAAPAIAAVVTLAACVIPAWRASAVDPAAAIRSE
jgi:putative ABC transport system permease protein